MKTKILLMILFITGQLQLANGQDLNEFFQKSNSFFNSYVEDGKVDYKAINDESETLTEVLELARDLTVTTDNRLNYQAFWINTYNLLVVRSVVDNYPLKSPLDIPGFFDKTLHIAGGTSITLNDIENIKLRKAFPDEPRFHFVLVCAGIGCPPIIDRAYLPASLEDQLETQTTKAINDPEFIRLGKKRLDISQIFEWYEEDFTRDGKSVLGFINTYRRKKIPADIKIGFYPYNWNLNDQN